MYQALDIWSYWSKYLSGSTEVMVMVKNKVCTQLFHFDQIVVDYGICMNM